jgi:hypothetical protein
MRFYLLPDKQDYKIMKVENEDIPLFQKRYATEILCEADTISELLVQFAARLEDPPGKPG